MTEPTSILLLGDSGTGKTGSLASLIKAGRRIRIIDLDNGSKIIRRVIQRECPEKLENLVVEKVSVKYKISSTGAEAERAPRSLARVGAIIDKWQTEVEPGDIIALDSLTALGRMCLVWARAQNPNVKEYRFHVGNAQRVIEPIISLLTADDFPCHTIVITHIDYRTVIIDDKGKETSKRSSPHMSNTKGYPNTLGEALNLFVASYFNEVFRYKTIGIGRAAKRVITTEPDGEVDVKNTAPFDLKGQYGVEDGLEQIFNVLTQE